MESKHYGKEIKIDLFFSNKLLHNDNNEVV